MDSGQTGLDRAAERRDERKTAALERIAQGHSPAVRQREFAAANRAIAAALEASGVQDLAAVYRSVAAEHDACAQRLDSGSA